MEAKGTPVALLEDLLSGNSAAGQFDFARNGNLIYFSTDRSAMRWPLAWIDRSGNTQPALPPASYLTYRLSPDGKRIAFIERSDNGSYLAVNDLERNVTTRLTTTNDQELSSLVWTPDARHIVYSDRAGVSCSLYWIRADGPGRPHRLIESGFNLNPSSFSPDGARLLYFGRSPQFKIWMVTLDYSDAEQPKAGAPIPFGLGESGEVFPTFSPDGNWVAYSKINADYSSVYVQRFPGTGERYLIGNSGTMRKRGGELFGCTVWSHNGRSLFYLSSDGQIMESAYSSRGDSFQSGNAHQWSSTAVSTRGCHLDQTPDGNRFLVMRSEEPPQTGNLHVTFLLNFFDEVRRRVPGGGR
jgi:Tol biopolymer transport system component